MDRYLSIETDDKKLVKLLEVYIILPAIYQILSLLYLFNSTAYPVFVAAKQEDEEQELR